MIDGVPVGVVREHHAYQAQQRTFSIDRLIVSAHHGGCGDLEVKAEAGHYFFRLGRQDALVGHREFDERYLVKTNDEAAMRYWFTPADAEAVLATYDPNSLSPFTLELDERVVRMVAWSYASTDLEVGEDAFVRRDDAVRAVATLAGRGQRLAETWRDRLAPHGLVAAGPVWRADDGYRLELGHGPCRVWVDFPWCLPTVRRAGLRTRVATPCANPLTAAVWHRQLPRSERPRLADVVDVPVAAPWRAEARTPEALDRFADLGEVLARCRADWLIIEPTTIAIGWESIVEDVALLTSAVAAVARWASAAAAPDPYR